MRFLFLERKSSNEIKRILGCCDKVTPLFRIIGVIRRRNVKNGLEDIMALPKWRTCSHGHRRPYQIDRIRLRTSVPSTILSTFGPSDLFLLSNLKNHWENGRKKIALSRKPTSLNNAFFRVKEVRALLN